MRLDKHTKKAIHRAIMDDVPKFFTNEDTDKQEIQAALVKAMSPLARKLYKQNPTALAKKHFCSWDYGFRSSFDLIVGGADSAAILKPYKDANDQRSSVGKRIEGIIEGCSTLKQLKTLLPEFEKYMPSEAEPTKNLPAVANVVADLTKLGWPKGGKK